MREAERVIRSEKYPRFALWDAGEEKLGVLLVGGQMLRGLPLEKAIRKVRTDDEVAKNVAQRYRFEGD